MPPNSGVSVSTTSASNVSDGTAVLNELELEHVLVVFRHGDRTPITRVVGGEMTMDRQETELWITKMPDLSFLTALNSGADVVDFHDGYHDREQREPPKEPRHGGRWPCGQLTEQGVHMMRRKGEQLRERYAEFIGAVEPLRDVHIQSTNIRRTLRSAQSVLAGMFPEYFSSFATERERFSGKKAKDGRFLILADEDCAIAPQHSYELFKDLGEMLAYELKHNAPLDVSTVSKRIRQLVGAQGDARVAWTGLREVLVCRRAHGLPVPDGLTDELFAQVCDFDAWLWFTLYGKRKFCHASFRRGVERIYSHLRAVRERRTHFKLSLFSAHDNSLVALICALSLQLPRLIPPYGAMLTFEVYRRQSSGEVFIKPLFEGREVCFTDHPQSALCPFAAFEAVALRFIDPLGDGSRTAAL